MTTADAIEALDIDPRHFAEVDHLGLGPPYEETPQGRRYRLGDLGDWYALRKPYLETLEVEEEAA